MPDFLEKIRDKDIVPKNTDELFLSNVGEIISDIFLDHIRKKCGE